jgi:hypothetical protein
MVNARIEDGNANACAGILLAVNGVPRSPHGHQFQRSIQMQLHGAKLLDQRDTSSVAEFLRLLRCCFNEDGVHQNLVRAGDARSYFSCGRPN